MLDFELSNQQGKVVYTENSYNDYNKMLLDNNGANVYIRSVDQSPLNQYGCLTS